MTVTELKDQELEEIEMIRCTCPVCGDEIRFAVSAEELKRAKTRSGVIKKAITHGDAHVTVVYVDEQGKVRRRYGYECRRIDKETASASKTRKKNQDAINIDDDTEGLLVDDPDGFLLSLLEDIEKFTEKRQ